MATVKINIGASTTPPPEDTIPPIGSSNIIMTAANTTSNTALYRNSNINKPLTWWDFTTDVSPFIGDDIEEYNRVKIITAGVIWQGNQIEINPSYYGTTVVGLYKNNVLIPLNTFIYKSELGSDLADSIITVDSRKSNIPVRFIKYKLIKTNNYEHPAEHTIYFLNSFDIVGRNVYTVQLDPDVIVQKGPGIHPLTMDDLDFFNAVKYAEVGANLYPANMNHFLSYEEEITYQQFLGDIVDNKYVTKIYFVNKYLDSSYGYNDIVDPNLTFNNRPVVYGQGILVRDIQLGLLKINTMNLTSGNPLVYNVLLEGFVTAGLYK